MSDDVKNVSNGMKDWVKDLDSKVDKLIVMTAEARNDLKHFVDRIDRQCERIEAVETELRSHQIKLTEMQTGHDTSVRNAKMFGKVFVSVFLIVEALSVAWKIWG